MGVPLDTGFPPNVDIADGFIVRFTALDAATGLVNPAVVVSNASLLVTNIRGGDLTTDLFDVELPTWLNVPVEDEEAAS